MRTPAIIHKTLRLPFSGPPVLATGSRLHNSLCITGQDQAWLSRSLGDLDSAAVCADHEVAATEIMIWQATIPALVARDFDPDMHSARFAIDLAGNLGVPNLSVQHHHAHAAAICAEHALMEPVVALILDDVGLGSDGSCWGGELLWVDGAGFNRLGHLVPLLKPGGDIAQRETWRMAAGVLHRLKRPEEISRRYSDHPASADLLTMLSEGRNCPPTSCAALLFATAANLLQVGMTANHADAACALEEAAIDYFAGEYGSVTETHWHITNKGELDFLPLLARLVEESDSRRGAATFHACMISGATEWVAKACENSGVRKVVLGGSCMQNRLLLSGLRDNLERRGLSVYEAQQILPDDSSVALGQAWVALNALRNTQA